MNIDTNQALPESDINEWKWSWRDEYMKWMSAFARTNGGTLYIGVNDDGYVVGLKDWRKLQEDLPNKFRDKLHISPTVRLHFATERGVNIRYPDGVPTEIASKDLNRYGQHGEVGADGIWRKQQEKTSSRQEAYIRMQDVLSRELKDSERKKMISLVTYFAEHDEISAADAAKLIGKSVPTATRYLGRMIELGTIEKIGMTNGVVYRLAGLGK